MAAAAEVVKVLLCQEVVEKAATEAALALEATALVKVRETAWEMTVVRECLDC